jgi:hypothetical protein
MWSIYDLYMLIFCLLFYVQNVTNNNNNAFMCYRMYILEQQGGSIFFANNKGEVLMLSRLLEADLTWFNSHVRDWHTFVLAKLYDSLAVTMVSCLCAD